MPHVDDVDQSQPSTPNTSQATTSSDDIRVALGIIDTIDLNKYAPDEKKINRALGLME